MGIVAVDPFRFWSPFLFCFFFGCCLCFNEVGSKY